MSVARFLQLHMLTSYPPANLNRDDLGRPKTAIVGGAQRLRISSQSLKRAWRTSNLFQEALSPHLGIRTRRMGTSVYEKLIEGKVDQKKALSWAWDIANVFGKPKGQIKEKKKAEEPSDVELEQLAHFSEEECAAIDKLVERLIKSGVEPGEDDLRLLKKENSAADIALFGRMLADSPAHNFEAAAQVAHAITVHRVAVEDDYFTAVDDLNSGHEDRGAAHLGETEYGSGLFYLYVCIDRELLLSNLANRADLAAKTIAAVIDCACQISPSGKQASFASRARASYALAELGDAQPRSLSVAFLKPIDGPDLLKKSIDALERCIENMDKVYGPCADKRANFDATEGKGTLSALKDLATEGLVHAVSSV